MGPVSQGEHAPERRAQTPGEAAENAAGQCVMGMLRSLIILLLIVESLDLTSASAVDFDGADVDEAVGHTANGFSA